jgi:hypothetical protein
MQKTYVIWWHSKFIDEIDRETTTIADIVEKTEKILNYLESLEQFEDQGQIKVRLTGSLNPMYIDILDPSVESSVAKNPLVETLTASKK